MDPITSILIAKALDGLHARQKVTAENIANAGTPGYRPLAVSFEANLKAAAGKDAAAIAAVEPRTYLASDAPIPGEQRLDLEIATAAQTSMRYGALIDLLGRQMALHRAVVSGGR
jgi:flagellar basal-body rod protein FlgB